MTEIDVQNNKVQIYTDYENKDICKSLSSRAWNPAAKCWEAPVSIIDEVLRKFPGATLSESAQAITNKISEIKTMASNAAGKTELPVKSGLKLYPFQIAGVEFLNAVDGKGMIADEMGLGKTVQALEYLYVHPDQRPALVVCPASLKINWQREATKWLSEKDTIQVINGKAISSGSSVYIINYDIIKKHEEALKFINFQVGILDESHYCFPGDTLIQTNQGKLKIEDIVENKLNVSVVCVDESGIIDTRKVSHYFKNYITDELIEIQHEHGIIKCTPNHLFWTEELGWVEASETKGLHLRILSNPIPAKENEALLLPDMCRQIDNQSPGREAENKPSSKTTAYSKEMRMVQTGVRNQSAGQDVGREALLQYELRSKLEEQSAGSNRTTKENCIQNVANEYRKHAPRCFNQDETNKPNGQSRNERENEADSFSNGAHVQDTRREWEINNIANNVGRSIEFANGSFNLNNTISENIQVPEQLQSRYSLFGEKTSNRSGWDRTQYQEEESRRPKENDRFKLSRVDGIESYKSRNSSGLEGSDSKGQFVYNLEVIEHHNYFADNVLVSNCKNYKAQRTVKIQELFAKIPHRILLTGTPILNRPSELYTQISIIQPGMFYSFFKFADRYCNMRKTKFGIDTSGASNIPELNERIKMFTVRRLKNQVLQELPDKIRSTLEFELDNKAEYQKAEHSIIEYIRSKKGDSAAFAAMQAQMLVEIESIKQLSAKGKLAAAFEWLEDFLTSGEKLVLFATHTETIQAIKAKFPDISVSLTGADDQKARQNAIDQFQNNPAIKIFIGNLQAAGVGITLTAASNVAFIELGWTPSAMLQAEDRCHRIGQKNVVNIYYLLGKQTIDIKIADIVTSKAGTIDAIMDGKQAPELNIMSNLIEYLS